MKSTHSENVRQLRAAPAPLVPAHVDLRRVRISFDPMDFFDDGAFDFPTEFSGYTAIRLMIASWRQRPAASLPNNSRQIFHLARLGNVEGTYRGFLNASSLILRDWILCSDGRLYHPIIADEALRVWPRIEKLRAKWTEKPAPSATIKTTPLEPLRGIT